MRGRARSLHRSCELAYSLGIMYQLHPLSRMHTVPLLCQTCICTACADLCCSCSLQGRGWTYLGLLPLWGRSACSQPLWPSMSVAILWPPASRTSMSPNSALDLGQPSSSGRQVGSTGFKELWLLNYLYQMAGMRSSPLHSI